MAANERDTIGESAGNLLVQVCRAHRNKAQALLARVELHPGQEFVLYNLWQDDGLTQSDLAARLCVQPATLTRMLDRMEKTGHVARRPDPADQRVSRVYLTDSGRALEAPVCAIWQELEAATVGELDAAEHDTLRRLLPRVLQGLS